MREAILEENSHRREYSPNIPRRSNKVGELPQKQILKSDVRGKKYPPFGSYIRTVFKSSLITSFPEIAASKSWIKRAIKIFVFIICVIGFTYQTLNFLQMYFAYPTVVNVLVSNPFEVVKPAFTFCNRNRERRSVVCDEVECSNSSVNGFCETFPKYCPKDGKVLTDIPFVMELGAKNLDWKIAMKRAHTEEMIKGCRIKIEGKSYRCRKPYRQVPAVTMNGLPNMCYTVESLWEKPDAKLETFPNTFTYEIDLWTMPEEYMMYTAPVMVQTAIHDRRRLVNPYAEGYALKGGIQYDAFVSMTEKELLPYPYDTNCTDYLKLWKRNGGTGPLNEMMCIEYCKLQTLLDLGLCIDTNVAYPHMETLCKRNISVTSDIIKNCTMRCGNPCIDHTYEIRYEEVGNYERFCNTENCKLSKTKLTVHFKRFRVTKFLYQPKFESIEMFSYIGGYMGMWLGLSLISLFDLFETVCYLLYYPVGHIIETSREQQVKKWLKEYGRKPYYSSYVY